MSKVVTHETVVQAAEALIAEGKRASVRAVIAALGGGSPNSVLLHLNRCGRPACRRRRPRSCAFIPGRCGSFPSSWRAWRRPRPAER